MPDQPKTCDRNYASCEYFLAVESVCRIDGGDCPSALEKNLAKNASKSNKSREESPGMAAHNLLGSRGEYSMGSL
jgi:hypothetical protein